MADNARDRVRQRNPSDDSADQYHNSLQQNLLTVLCHFDKAGKRVADRIDPALFDGAYREVAERLLRYWKKYNRAPAQHAYDLFEDAPIKKIPNGRMRTYEHILRDMIALSENADLKFIDDQLREFEKQQLMKDAILKGAEALNSGRHDAAEVAMEILRPILTTSTTGKPVLASRAVADFDHRELKWLWYPFIPSGMITTLFGDGAVGKSTVALDLAARITKGRLLPQFGDEKQQRTRKGSVLILTKEEDTGLIVRPRLEAAGADVKHVHTLGYQRDDGSQGFDVIDRLDNTMTEVEAMVDELDDVRLLIVDPITDFTGKTDIYRDDAVRAFLSPFSRMAAKYDLAIINILHLNKKTDSGVRHRVMGSVAFPNVSRSSVLIAKSRDDEDRRLMVQEKANLTPEKRSVAFNLRNVRNHPRIEWEADYQTVDLDEVLSGKGPTKNKQAADLLRDLLAEGPMRMTEVEERITELGIGSSTLKAAKKEVNVESTKAKDGWWWSLPQKRKGARTHRVLPP